jgi:hypothetical protein
MHGAHSRKGEASPSHFSLRIKNMIQAFNDDKLEEPSCTFALCSSEEEHFEKSQEENT